MEEAELEKQRRMVTKSSIKRKPFADLTNIVPKPSHTSSFSQSKRPGSSTASNSSSIGTTQNRIHVHHPVSVPPDHPVPSTPLILTPDHLVGDENHIAHARRRSIQKTRSNVKAAVPSYQTSVKGTRSNGKEGSVPLCSSMLEKIKDQGKGNLSSLDKTRNYGKEKSVALHCSSMEKMKDKRKASDVPSSAHHMKNAKNSMESPIPRSTEEKEKGVQCSNSSVGNTNIGMSITMPPKDKGKAIAVPLNYPPTKNMKHNMVEVRMPLSGVIIKDRGETVAGSSRAQKDDGKAVSTPISYHTQEKKDNGSSCPPLLRTTGNRNEADDAEDIFQSKPQTDPRPDKKKRRCSAKKDEKKYALPQDFVEQQRAYFKEIDDFELEVEEVSV